MSIVAGVIVGLVGALWVQRKLSAFALARKRNTTAAKVVENHEVAGQLESAKTNEEADAALDANAAADDRK